MGSARRIAVVASASGNGKTTLGRQLAAMLDVPFVELDALVHGPGWIETPDEVLRAEVQPIVASDSWVIDGTYQRKLGTPLERQQGIASRRVLGPRVAVRIRAPDPLQPPPGVAGRTR